MNEEQAEIIIKIGFLSLSIIMGIFAFLFLFGIEIWILFWIGVGILVVVFTFISCCMVGLCDYKTKKEKRTNNGE